jgi:adenosylhomocysteine nucleosidase
MPADAPIVVLFALPDESGAFRRVLQVESVSGRGVEMMVRGRVGEAPVVVAHTGVGAAAAARRTAQIVAAERPRLIVSAGFAGGLQAAAPVGTVVFDARGSGVAGPGGCVVGKIVSEGAVIETALAKRELGERSGAVAVDMETAAMASAAQEAGVPVVALRVISDPVDADMPVPMGVWFDVERQRPRVGALLGWLARHPGSVWPFARFVWGLGPAKAALARGLGELVLGTAGAPARVA